MQRSLRKLIFTVVAVAAIAFLLYKFRNSITLEGFRWDVLAHSWGQASYPLFLLGILGTYFAHVIRASRWQRFSKYLGKSNWSTLYACHLMGFASIFLLGRAGEPVRPLLIARKERLSTSGTFGIYFLERIFDAGAAAVFAGLALMAISRGTYTMKQSSKFIHVVHTGGIALLIGFACVAAFLVYFRLHGAEALTRRLERSLLKSGKVTHTGFKAKLAAVVAGFSEGLQAIRTCGDLFIGMAWTAAHWILIVFIYVWVAHAFGGTLGTITFSGAMLVLAFTLVGSAVQLPGVGGGAQVALFLVFTLFLGVEKEPAAAAAIAIWLITFASPVIVGVPLLLRQGWSMDELKKTAQAEEEAAVEEEEERLIAPEAGAGEAGQAGTGTDAAGPRRGDVR